MFLNLEKERFKINMFNRVKVTTLSVFIHIDQDMIINKYLM